MVAGSSLETKDSVVSLTATDQAPVPEVAEVLVQVAILRKK